ncbi:S8 family serine peptidase [Planobispora takensis]|uniref:Peptidase S8/S53 domain-containing protein n=1 Tax=Planobispora takensis TaxID=1367882 RepID=A0A8J3T2C6_9ACTN|nr:S8 family serine peptidase [Planobispora takensis]GII03981.1 hypothetical protein Pta02_59890 [Planobispora takensis]
MSTLDVRLRHLLRTVAERPDRPRAVAPPPAERVGWRPGDGAGTVDVLVRAAGAGWGELAEEVSPLSPALSPERGSGRGQGSASGTGPEAATGAAPETGTGVYAARVPLDRLERLAAHPAVERVEASRLMFPELNVSRPDVRAEVFIDGETGPVRGKRTIVAIIDSGIDYTHPSFRHADGSSRVLYLWDQAAPAASGGSVPYGAEYLKTDLDKALADADPLQVVPHRDDETGHGTHVAGIAAGDESGFGGDYSGIAPEADLVVVALAGEPGVSLGRSAQLVEAVDYAVRRAEGHPVAVTISQGMNGGGHCGETLVERALDDLARRPGVAIVKSAGNERRWDVHAGGVIGQGETVSLDVLVRPGDRQDDIIEIWFPGGDRLDVAVVPPTGSASAAVAPGQLRLFTTDRGDLVTIDSEEDSAGTGDTSTTVILTAGDAAGLEAGLWRLVLYGDAVHDGRYDAWIERAPRTGPGAAEQSRFAPGSADPSRTISVPGTARRVITVASYMIRPSGAFDPASLGGLSDFSSAGPTRFGDRKPDLAAPGEIITSARCRNSARLPQPDGGHTLMAGTSMAAPHVCGAAALILSQRPELTGEQVGQILTRSARRDGPSAAAPDDAWGAGKLDAASAVALARTAAFPRILEAGVTGSTLTWETDTDTTWSVRYHTVPGRLLLGRALGERTGTSPGRRHRVDLSALGPGVYACEIVVFSPDGFWTRDDDAGRSHLVPVGVPLGAPTGAPTGAPAGVPAGVAESGERAPQADVVPAGAPIAQSAPDGGPGDDLKLIKGIGPKAADLLREAGIIRFADLAARSAEEVASLTEGIGIGPEKIVRQDWLGQAAALAAAEADRPAASAPPGRVHRQSFTLAITVDARTREALACEVSHHQTGDARSVRGWDLGEILAFIEERGDLRLGEGPGGT